MPLLKRIAFLVGLLSFFCINSLNATTAADASLLNNMVLLSQSRGMVWKAYKNYVMMGMKNDYKNPKKHLNSSVNGFENAIKDIETYATKKHLDQMVSIISDIQKEWIPLKANLLSQQKPESIETIDRQSMHITRTIIKALKIMGKNDPTGNWNYLAKAQKAQNIAERMAVLYLDHAWGSIGKQRYNKMMTKATTNFVKVQSLIKKSKFMDKNIASLLDRANKDYTYFKIMWKNNHGAFIPTLIFNKSASISQAMGEVTSMLQHKIIQQK